MQTAHNTRLAHNSLSAVMASAKHQSALRAFVVFCYSTFFCARKNASHFSSSGTKKRRQS